VTLDLVPADSPLVVLGVAAHPDDLEIGCAAAVRQIVASRPDAKIHWLLAAAGSPARLEEARSAAQALLGAAQAGPLLVAGDYRDGYLPDAWAALKDAIRALTADVSPDLVLAPSRSDRHQDHRVMAELAWQLYRGSTIWEYEIPKWEGDLGQPNLYVPISAEELDAKFELLRRNFPSQADKPWFDKEVFAGLARLRGIECGARYAEAFVASKVRVRLR
jgi:LmbE family N-acetylglucosaminyl deacetylase